MPQIYDSSGRFCQNSLEGALPSTPSSPSLRVEAGFNDLFSDAMKNRDTIAILDFGGQYAHLIANRIRRLGVYSEIQHNTTPVQELKAYKGLILSGGPHSVLDSESPRVDPEICSLGIPILGLCYGHQLLSQMLGGTVRKGGDSREYGIAHLHLKKTDLLFQGVRSPAQIWMSHGDSVDSLAPGFEVIGSTPDCATAAVADSDRKLFGLQFHPEVTDTPQGMTMLENFLRVCNVNKSWNPDRFVEEIGKDVRAACDDRKVFLLVSGGVDSTVAFMLLNKELGPDRVLGLHIDNGLMRKDESRLIADFLGKEGFQNLHVVDASQHFLDELEGVTDPEEKRKIIGNVFVTIQEQYQRKLGLNAQEWLLGQGTIYPDTIESAGTKHADKIKTHHNRVDVVLELIEKGLVVEPLAQLYKDEVRLLGEKLGLPHELIWRHPFPGPGLGVRVLCSDGNEPPVDEKTVAAVHELSEKGGFRSTVLPLKSVGVQGDSRTYAHPALIAGPRDWGELELLSTKITNRISGVNRVVYALSEISLSYTPLAVSLSKARLDMLREIDDLVTQVLRESGEYDEIWQMPVVLLPLANERGEECVVLRPVKSQEAMTARFAPLCDQTIDRIVLGAKSIHGIGDVFFDVTHKPPATIEWE